MHRGPSSAVEVLAPRRNAVEVARKRRLAPVPYNKNSLLPRARPLIILLLLLAHPLQHRCITLTRAHVLARHPPIARPGSRRIRRAGVGRRQRLRGKQLLEYGSLRRSLRGPPGAPLPIWRVGRRESADGGSGAATPLAARRDPKMRGPLREPAGGHPKGLVCSRVGGWRTNCCGRITDGMVPDKEGRRGSGVLDGVPAFRGGAHPRL